MQLSIICARSSTGYPPDRPIEYLLSRAGGEYQPTKWVTKGMSEKPKVFVYVLRSVVDQKRYIGLTNNLDRRLREHNHGHTKSTMARAPFELIYKEGLSSLKEAREREKYLKSGAGRRYLNIIKK